MSLFDPSQIGINIAAFQFMKSIAGPALNSFMLPFAESFFIVLPVLALYLIWKRDTNVYAFILAIVGLFIIGEALKYIFQVPRPCQVPSLSWINAPACETGFSFPSNHAIVLTGLVFFFRKYRFVEALYVVWLAIILFGRVYLGAHYLTDVIAGAVLSLIITYVINRYRAGIYSMVKRLHLAILTPRGDVPVKEGN